MKKRINASMLIVASVVAMSACSASSSSDSTAPVAETTTPSSGSSSKVAGPVEISVTVGVDSSATRVEEVALGSEVVVRLLNPAADDDFHLHGYDLSPGGTPKGETAVITFSADAAGDFEIESHVTDSVLAVISVK